MATPWEYLSEQDRDIFRHISKEQLIKHVGDFVNIIWFKDKETMDLFYNKAGKRVRQIIGPQRTGVERDTKTGKYRIVFFSEEPFMKPEYVVAMEGVEMKSLMLYP